ncbi:HAD family hydrolase [Adhaeretor mobilis]|uniref:Haloacid dehalogenase-like hydrolase n=1 Tax=Adhaeretor mobilis TaxID=1930276 RepID=A0A517MT88_9BACT|nr:HAD family hydrolase [Adhaeretor mobilis]QDS98007.1 haloacid dehalogenase-like hydrolase [Adhaeretor mobilis]
MSQSEQQALEQIIKQASRPLEPQPTAQNPELPKLAGVRAVLFDIYGTLIISGSGDIGAADPTIRGQAFADALAAVGVEYQGDCAAGARALRHQIDASHDRSRAAGVEFPEIDIVEVWRLTCEELARGNSIAMGQQINHQQLAVEFEVRTNPVWPMPGLLDCLADLKRKGLILGIISNAQFFTPLVFPALARQTLDNLGVAPELRYYSYEYGRAKPGEWLYEKAARGLADQDNPIHPTETLYVGNDLRNDIWPAAQVGFRTTLFAGDQRSLRLREDAPNRDQQPEPDAIVTQLNQIPTIIGESDIGESQS